MEITPSVPDIEMGNETLRIHEAFATIVSAAETLYFVPRSFNRVSGLQSALAMAKDTRFHDMAPLRDYAGDSSIIQCTAAYGSDIISNTPSGKNTFRLIWGLFQDYKDLPYTLACLKMIDEQEYLKHGVEGFYIAQPLHGSEAKGLFAELTKAALFCRQRMEADTQPHTSPQNTPQIEDVRTNGRL